MTEAITPERVLEYLADVEYPAGKDALVSAAERSGAPDEVLGSLRASQSTCAAARRTGSRRGTPNRTTPSTA